ncbi:MAG: aminoglycoside phosphotransferase family protein [Pyrinomonadaceae bacterium]
MNATFKDSLPDELITHVTSMCGERGVRWLTDLERNVGDLERIWSIKIEKPFSAGEYNFVAPALHADGELMVLKIAPPFDTVEIFGEASFLRHRDGNGAVRLIAEDTSRFAILLEHALPGENLAEMFKENETAATQPAIEVLRSILSPPPRDTAGIGTLDNWFDGLRRYSSTEFPAGYAAKALKIYDRLSGQSARTLYLHGDFHPGNIVSATRSPFLAIDPKGIIGHMGYDVAVYLNNFHSWNEHRSDIGVRLVEVITAFASAFDIHATELMEWAFAQKVLSAWWTFDETPEMYNNEVAKADIWDV